MAAPLNVNTSIVDFLKSKGQDSSFGARSTLFGQKGLDKSLGKFTGSAQQNTTLLNLLRGGSSSSQNSPTPGNITSPTAGSSPPPGSSTSGSAPQMSRLDFAQKGNDELLRRDAEERAKVEASRNKLTDFLSNLEDPTERFKRIRGEQGVQAQQDIVDALGRNVLDVEDIIRNIEPSVNTRSGDFFMNEADRQALVARESQPHQKNLIDVLRQKEREEIGLSGKNALVGQLLELSFRGDEQRAKPLQMGVDFSTSDRQIATSLLKDVLSRKTSAFNADVTSQERRQEAELAHQRRQEAATTAFERSKQLASFKESIKKINANKKLDPNTEAAWNSIVARADSEFDVFQAIDASDPQMRAAGIDVDELWKMHNELTGKVGVGGDIRAGKKESSTERLIQQLENA